MKNDLISFSKNHRYGICTANLFSAAMACTEKRDIKRFWLFDSRARGPKGHRATPIDVSCFMRFVSIEDLQTDLHRNLIITKPNDINVTPVTQ